MKSPDLQARIPEPNASPLDLANAMTSAAIAIRNALLGLSPESCLILDAVLDAFRQVERVGDIRQLLRAHSAEPYGTEVSHAYSEYRGALVEWDRHLPRLHGWLLAERARLKSRREHTRRVHAWTEADRQTR